MWARKTNLAIPKILSILKSLDHLKEKSVHVFNLEKFED